jgi:hypothetical protein
MGHIAREHGGLPKETDNGVRTNGEQEWTSGKGLCRRMQFRIEQRNEWLQIHNVNNSSCAPRIDTYVYPRIEASLSHDQFHIHTEAKSERSHISNSFSTSSVFTSLCTKISGGLVLSINDLRKLRFSAGPGMKNSLAATPC